MHPRTEEFRDRAREKHNLDIDVHEFPEGTRTAEDAAEALDCDVAQILKSLVFSADGLVVVLVSGSDRVDEELLASELGVTPAEIDTADPQEVKQSLGWSIGGVPPFLHETDVPVLMDSAVLQHEEVWAAAGTPKAVFPASPEDIRSISGARTVDVSG